jgi:hypothetical protein
MRRTALLAAALGGLTLAVVAATFPLAAMAHGLTDAAATSWLVAVPFAAVGLLVALRQPGNRMGWLLLAAGLFIAVNFAASFYTDLVYRLGHPLPLGAVALLVQPSWAPAIVCFGLAILLFPDGRLPSARWHWVLRIYLGIGAAWAVGAIVITAAAIAGHVHVDASGNLQALDNPTGDVAWWGVVQGVFFALLAGVGLASLVQQAVRFRRSAAERRQQLKWLLSGTAVAAIGLGLSLVGGSLSGLVGAGIGAGFLAVAALPASIGVAVLRYRLYDIDRLISRTLAYAVVTGLLIGLYVGLVLLATRVLPLSSGVAVAGSTLAAAALFAPLRRRVQHAVDRRFNRARYDADLIVAAFAARLQDSVDLSAVHADLAATIEQALQPEHLSVWTGTA